MTKDNINDIEIDAVILWVDGNDKKHQAKMLPYLEANKSIKSKKFKTRFAQVDEIEYSVNSLLKYAPYLRNIFIITDEQTPSFLENNENRNKYEKVSVVDHKVIFSGYEEFLPTFNSRTIETFMFRIPDLAEHFIYLNDDFFLINTTQPQDFFQNKLPVLRGKWLNFNQKLFSKKTELKKTGHKAAQQKAASLAGFNKYYNFRHTPHPLRKSTFENYFKNNKAIFIENIKYKFRSDNQLLLQGLINHLEIKNKTSILKKDLQLLYFRSYKKPLLWYKFNFKSKSKTKLFLALQNLSICPPNVLSFILNWLENRFKM